jgi:hypothetical protein
MKYFIYIAGILLMLGCKNSSVNGQEKIVHIGSFPFSRDTIYIHFQAGYENDSIFIINNDSLILKKTLRTDNVLGFADEYKLPKKDYKSNLKVILNKGDQDYIINIKGVRRNFVGIWYDSLKDEFKYYEKETPFRYE